MRKGKMKMTPTVTDEVKNATKKVKRTLFNLNTFKRESKETEITLPPAAKSFAEVMEAVGHNEDKIVELYNKQKDRNAIMEAKREMGGADLVSPKLISGLIGGFAAMFPIDSKLDPKKAKKAQNDAILEFVRSTPAVLDSLKTIASAMAQTQTEVEDEEEDDAEEEGENQ